MVRWSILILTMRGREAMLERLLLGLMPQVDGYDDIEVMVSSFNPLMPVGENREQMRQRSIGRYINFIDDDDTVSENYVARIYPRLDGTVDYVGFNVEQTFVNLKFPGCIERHTLRAKGVWSDGTGAYDGHWRDISHLNPMKRELSLRVPMRGWPAEDSRWAETMRALGIVRTEYYVDEVLYNYLTRTYKPEMEAISA